MALIQFYHIDIFLYIHCDEYHPNWILHTHIFRFDYRFVELIDTILIISKYNLIYTHCTHIKSTMSFRRPFIDIYIMSSVRSGAYTYSPKYR